jgi:hypothetical protein
MTERNDIDSLDFRIFQTQHTLNDANAALVEAEATIRELTAERDAARRLYCQTLWEYQNFRRTRKHAAPEAIAVAHNWDCYA